MVVKLKAIDGGKENQHEAVTPALNQMGLASAEKSCWLTTMATLRSMQIPTRYTITTVWYGFL